ncbi:MAG: hypothetical protein KAX49_01975 [Halanaerobiales bacterium]|nr:hypothetical protein [Halanaerobiales bacterium]
MNIIKPIEVFHEIKDEKIAKKIIEDLKAEPSEEAKRKNEYALSLLRKALRG